MDVSPGRMTVVTGAGAPFGRKVVRSGVALEVPSSKIQFSSLVTASQILAGKKRRTFAGGPDKQTFGTRTPSFLESQTSVRLGA